MLRLKTIAGFRRAFVPLLLAVALGAAALSSSGNSLAAPAQAQLGSAQQRLQALRDNFEIVVERYNMVHDKLDRLRSTIAQTELVVARVQKRMQARQKDAIELAQELYKGGSTDALEALLASKSISSADARLEYLQSSQTTQTKVFDKLAIDRALLNKKLAELDTAKNEATAAANRLGRLKVTIKGKLDSQQKEIDRLQAQIAAERRRQAKLAAAQAAARRQAQQQAARATAAAATVPAPSVPAPSVPAPSVPAPSVPASSAPAPAAPTASQSAQPAPARGSAAVAVDTALAQVGKPYVWGAAGPDSFDCSGLTSYAWAAAGVSLPHSSAAQYAVTARVSSGSWQPGDLLFYGSPIHHVAMYIGNGQMVEAPYSGTTVRVASARLSDYVGAGRP